MDGPHQLGDSHAHPIVNMNGSDPNDMAIRMERVRMAAAELQRALADIAPHGRDYPGDLVWFQRDAKVNVRQRNEVRAIEQYAHDTQEHILMQLGA